MDILRHCTQILQRIMIFTRSGILAATILSLARWVGSRQCGDVSLINSLPGSRETPAACSSVVIALKAFAAVAAAVQIGRLPGQVGHDLAASVPITLELHVPVSLSPKSLERISKA